MNKSKDKTAKEIIKEFFTRVIGFLQFLLDGSFITSCKAPTMEQLRVDTKY